MQPTKTGLFRSNRFRSVLAIVVVAFVLLLAACDTDVTDPGRETTEAIHIEEPSPTSSEDERGKGGESVIDETDNTDRNTVLQHQLIEAHNRLGMLILKELIPTAGHDNVFLSPTSIALALSMAYHGADGETAQVMAEALQLHGIVEEDLKAWSLALIDMWTLPSDEENDLGADLNIANSIWYRNDYAFQKSYLNEMAAYYKAQVEGLDFYDPQSADTINRWVSDATKQLIPTVVDNLDPDMVMMLINAVYFKGDWTTPFDKRATRDMPFHLDSGDIRDVPMMYRDGHIDYYAGDGYQAVRLPYGDSERLAMYVFLPNPDQSIADFGERFTSESMADAFHRFVPAQGQVMLPRIDIAFKTQLNTALGALGMDVAFDPHQADFSRMKADDDGRNLFIGDVIHQSVLKVDEEGTEAAAVTSIDIRVTSMPIYKFKFQADRPFALAIREDVTEAVLFTGIVMDPQN